ncbi:MAG: DNA polymerase III subunit beta [Thermoleophilia bacterium]|jgi:DNA polymerase-3 subunit beta
MRITCAKDLLLENLQTVLKTVATKSTMPVLSGIRIETKDDGRVEMASTDMELSLRLTLEVKIEREGAAVAPGRLLTDVIKSLPSGEVSLDFDEKEQLMDVTSGSASFRLNCLPSADFPRLVEMPEGGAFEIDCKPLMDTINTVARAASRDETRPVLTGILIKFSKEKVKMVATDSYRLSVCETKADTTLTDKKEVIVPRTSMEELARICGQVKPERVNVGLIDGQVIFSAGNIFLTSRLIEGQFPNYQQLLPEEFKHEIQVDKEELLEVVARIGLMAQKNAPIKMKFDAGQLTVSAQTPQVGEASESLAVAFQGEELEIGFNPEFLKDGIESVGEQNVALRIISPLRPGLLKGAGDDFLYLIMPVRLTG